MLNILKPTKSTVDSEITSVANGIFVQMNRCHRIYSRYAMITDEEFTAMGYTVDDIYAIRAACVAFENLYRAYTQTELLDASKPQQFIEPLVQTLVV